MCLYTVEGMKHPATGSHNYKSKCEVGYLAWLHRLLCIASMLLNIRLAVHQVLIIPSARERGTACSLCPCISLSSFLPVLFPSSPHYPSTLPFLMENHRSQHCHNRLEDACFLRLGAKRKPHGMPLRSQAP